MDWRIAYATGGTLRKGPGGKSSPAWLCLCLFLTLGLSLALRYFEYSLWSGSAPLLGGEFLLPGPYGYRWPAAARGFGPEAEHPFALLLGWLAEFFSLSPANMAFWLPLVLGCFVSAAVFFWVAAMGFPAFGIFAGLLTVGAPGFMLRTLPGLCGPESCILLFSLILFWLPTLWLKPWLRAPLFMLGQAWDGLVSLIRNIRHPDDAEKDFDDFRYSFLSKHRELWREIPAAGRLVPETSLRCGWLMLLALAGIMGWNTQGWAEFIPIMLLAGTWLMPLLILLFGPRGGRLLLLGGALCFVLPLLLGWSGFLAALCLAVLQGGLLRLAVLDDDSIFFSAGRFFYSAWFLIPLWLCLSMLPLVRYLPNLGAEGKTTEAAVDFFQEHVLDPDLPAAAHVPELLRRSSAAVAASSSPAGLVFPEAVEPVEGLVSRQELGAWVSLLLSFHPWPLVSLVGFSGFAFLLLVHPAVAFIGLVPLCAWIEGASPLDVVFYSAALYGLGLGGLLARFLLDGFFFLGESFRIPAAAGNFCRRYGLLHPLRLLLSLVLCALLIRPILERFPLDKPDQIISAEQAEALVHLGSVSPADSVIWTWWPWGQAAQYFAGRETVSDISRHQGARLFVPAAVYSSTNPVFSRQMVAMSSAAGDDPGRIFSGRDPAGAEGLLGALDSSTLTGAKDGPGDLVPLHRKQYLVVSLDMLARAAEITRIGNWDFLQKQGQGYTVQPLEGEVRYSIDLGVIMPGNGTPRYVSGIDVFAPEGLSRRIYFRIAEELRMAVRKTGSGEEYYLFSGDFADSLMYRLLVSSPDDAYTAPFFKLVFDNVLTRVYEVL